MPLYTFDTKVKYDAAYSVLTPEGAWVNYDRAGLYPWLDRQVKALLTRYTWPAQSRILIVGCGFGWGMEVFRANGLLNAWGTDTSAHIQATKALQSPIPERILNADVGTSAGRTLVRTATGVNNAWHVIITEDVLPCYTDVEALALASSCRGMLANNGVLVHIVTPLDPGNYLPMNWKSIEGWKALLPLDTIVRVGGEATL